jgi:hypothetical protein
MARTSLWVLLLGASSLVACKKAEEPPTYAPAGAAPETPQADAVAAPADEAPAFSTIEEAQAAFARAEQDLLTLQGGAPAGAGAPAATAPPATAPADAEGESTTRPKAEAAPEPAPKDDKGAGRSCSGLCRAFGSLSRAADAICRLAGEADERCTRARGSVRDNFQRVSVCRCPPP